MKFVDDDDDDDDDRIAWFPLVEFLVNRLSS